MNIRKHKAFTLIELLVVIAIIGILAGFIFVSMSASITAAQDAKRKVDISNIQKAILMYEAAGGVLPNTSGSDCDLDPGNASACDDFATKLQPYLKTIPTAPDGDFYVYNHDASADSTTFSIETTLSNDNTYGYSTSGGGGWYENPATPPPSGITITEVAHVDDGGEANDVYFDASYNYVFLANGTDGLRVYQWQNGTTLASIDNVNDGGTALGLMYDGINVYLANGSDGLRAYSFDNTAPSPTLGTGNNIDSGGEARGVCLAWYGGARPELANGTDGLRQYSYNGSTFTALQNINSGGEATAADIYTAGSNYWTYLANGTDGLRIYSQPTSGGAFTELAHVDDGTAYDVRVDGAGSGIFVADGTDGLRFYYYDEGEGTLTTNYHINDGGTAMGFDYDSNYYFLANGDDGLRIYSDGGTNFVLAGHIDSGGEARKVSIAQINEYIYIFLANGADGLRVYRVDTPGGGGGE